MLVCRRPEFDSWVVIPEQHPQTLLGNAPQITLSPQNNFQLRRLYFLFLPLYSYADPDLPSISAFGRPLKTPNKMPWSQKGPEHQYSKCHPCLTCCQSGFNQSGLCKPHGMQLALFIVAICPHSVASLLQCATNMLVRVKSPHQQHSHNFQPWVITCPSLPSAGTWYYDLNVFKYNQHRCNIFCRASNHEVTQTLHWWPLDKRLFRPCCAFQNGCSELLIAPSLP